MIGPDDISPVEPYEYLSIDGSRHAQWRCPRCHAANRTRIQRAGACPSICRTCFGAASLNSPPAELIDSKRTVWMTLLTDGTSIRVQPDGEGGHRFDVKQGERSFGGYDSRWTRQAAYDAAQQMIQARRRR